MEKRHTKRRPDCSCILCANLNLDRKKRLDGWEQRLEIMFNEKFGFGIWQRKNVPHSQEIPSTSVLEFFREFGLELSDDAYRQGYDDGEESQEMSNEISNSKLH